MSRTLATNTNAALSDAFIVPVFFVAIEFDSDPLYVHTDLGSITTLSQTWTGVGDLGQIGSVEENIKISPYKTNLILAIVDESATGILSESLTQNFYQRPCTIYLGARNSITGALLDDPDEIMAGKIDTMQISHGANQSFIQVTVESEMSEFEKANGELYSDTQLQSEFSGDLFFQYLERLQNYRVQWGSTTTEFLSK